jgi:hypothetical protein
LPATGPIRVPDHAAARVGVDPGDHAAVVVRPERMMVRQGAEGSSDVGTEGRPRVSLAGRLRGVIYLGSDRKFGVDVEHIGPVVVRAEAGAEGVEAVVGPDVTVSWDVEDSVVVTDVGQVSGLTADVVAASQVGGAPQA